MQSLNTCIHQQPKLSIQEKDKGNTPASMAEFQVREVNLFSLIKGVLRLNPVDDEPHPLGLKLLLREK